MHVAETSFTSASVENLSQMNLDTVTAKIAFCPSCCFPNIVTSAKDSSKSQQNPYNTARKKVYENV